MKKCPKCGAETTSKFCPECGTKMEESSSEKVCPHCGKVSKSNFCGNCGYNFTQPTVDVVQTVNSNQGQNAEKTSMILGAISCGCLFFGWSSIASIVLGAIGLKKAKEESASGEKTAGYILCLIGLIGGIIELVYCVIALLFLGQMTSTFFNIFNQSLNGYSDVINDL